MTNMYNLEEIDTTEQTSEFYNTTISVNGNKNHRVVFSKLDINALLGRFYEND